MPVVYVPLFCHLETLYHLKVKCMNVPIVMAALLYQVVGESRHLLHIATPVADGAYNGATAGGSQVYCKEKFLLFHIIHLKGIRGAAAHHFRIVSN